MRAGTAEILVDIAKVRALFRTMGVFPLRAARCSAEVPQSNVALAWAPLRSSSSLTLLSTKHIHRLKST